MKYSFFLGVSFFIAICFFAVKMPTAQAAFYNASGVLGQTDSNGNMVYTTNGINNNKGASSITPQGLYLPLGAAADPINHRLFVEDFTNGRILVFKLDANDNIATTSASYVLGQVNLTSTSTGVSTSTLSLNVPTLVGPEGISYDSANQRLFVMDSGNSRVMVFDVATSTISNGEAAIAEIGQANFTSNTQLCLQNRLGYQPTELEYDATNSRLFVDDFGNSRILVFDASTTTLASTPMGENASAVIGQTTYTSCNAAATQSRLNLPMGVSYDGGTGRLFVTDKNNHRVLVFDASPATLAATSTGDIAMDVIGQTNYTNNGHSTTQTGLNFPSGGVYDPISKRLFVTDNSNSRIMIFDGSTTTLASTPIGENAIDVMGQANYTSTLTLNNYQGGTLVGPSIFNTPFFSGYDSTYQHLFVPDWNNNRLLEFNFGGGAYFGTDNFSLSNAATPSANSATQNLVLNNSSLAQSSGNWSISSSASWLTFTANSGSLAIGASTTIGFIENFSTLPYGYSYATATITSAQAANSPINITVTISRSYPASAGLGQLDGSGNMVYTSNSSNNGQGSPNAQGFSFPLGATVDSISHRLFVSDYFNNRVLVYPLDSANNISTTTASYVLGQSSFSVNNGAVSTSTLSGPWGCAYDSANQRLFVTDSGFNRVMVYSVPTSTNLTGKNASAVIGQTTFSGSGSNHTQSTLNNPRGLDYDPVTGRLFVVDFGNHRVLVFDASTSTLAATSTGDIAQAVIGQTNYTNNGSSSLQNRLNFPSLDVYDSATGRLFVDDKINNRILVFDGSTTTLASTPTGENAMDVIGQTSFTNNSTGSTASTLNIPTGVNYDSVTGRLIVDDSSNNRILFFDASTTTLASTPTGESAEGVIGQADFISNSTAVSQSALLNPTGTGWDSTGRHLFEPDWSNNRVLQFNLVNITNSSLANGGIGASYSQTITSTSSQGTVSYSLAAGSFPSGISLNTSTGVISGTPTAVGSYPVSIKGTDTITSGSFQTQSSFTLSVASTTPPSPALHSSYPSRHSSLCSL